MCGLVLISYNSFDLTTLHNPLLLKARVQAGKVKTPRERTKPDSEAFAVLSPFVIIEFAGMACRSSMLPA